MLWQQLDSHIQQKKYKYKCDFKKQVIKKSFGYGKKTSSFVRDKNTFVLEL